MVPFPGCPRTPCSTCKQRACLGPGVQPRLRPDRGGPGLDAGRRRVGYVPGMGRKWATHDDFNRMKMPVKLRGEEALIELVNIGANRLKGSYGGFGGACSF